MQHLAAAESNLKIARISNKLQNVIQQDAQFDLCQYNEADSASIASFLPCDESSIVESHEQSRVDAVLLVYLIKHQKPQRHDRLDTAEHQKKHKLLS